MGIEQMSAAIEAESFVNATETGASRSSFIALPPGPVDPASLRWEEREGYVVVRHKQRSIGRKVLFLNRYGGMHTFLSWTQSRILGHHLWGCLELAYAGYDIILPRDQKVRGRVLSHVMTDVSVPGMSELGSDDILYCAHNVLFWAPLLSTLRRRAPKLVSLLYAKEPLMLGNRHAGILGLTNVAVRHAAQFSRPLRRWIGWSVEQSHLFQVQPYAPKFGLSCGITLRDFDVIARAYDGLDLPLRLCCRAEALPPMPPNVTTAGHLTHTQLFTEMYRDAAYVLLCLARDDARRSAVGYTNILEAMALGRPIIKTRTGAVDSDIDIEAERIGLYVEPGDADGLRKAVRYIVEHPQEAAEMGRRARALCETRYSTQRFARDLHGLFSAI